MYKTVQGSVQATVQEMYIQYCVGTVFVNWTVQEVYKELSQGVGRDSPESGSLYSDYESGHQYEQVRQFPLL
jgi:hypothetical protein